jgi:hypothetical protein
LMNSNDALVVVMTVEKRIHSELLLYTLRVVF